MSTPVIENGSLTRFTTSVVIAGNRAQLLGLFVSNASTTPTLEILNAVTSGTGTAVGQFTPVSGSWYAMPFAMSSGITILVGGSVSGCVSWLPQAT